MEPNHSLKRDRAKLGVFQHSTRKGGRRKGGRG